MESSYSDSKPGVSPHIRWLIRRDLPYLLPFDSLSEEQYLAFQRQRNVIGMVVEDDEEPVGCMFYRLDPTKLVLLHLFVVPEFRRLGFGSALLGKLYSKIQQSNGRRNRILTSVSDAATDLHLLLKSQGYQAIKVLRRSDGDRYRFVRHLTPVGQPGTITGVAVSSETGTETETGGRSP